MSSVLAELLPWQRPCAVFVSRDCIGGWHRGEAAGRWAGRETDRYLWPLVGKNPALEDLIQLTQDVARELKGWAVWRTCHALEVKESLFGQVFNLSKKQWERTQDTGGELLKHHDKRMNLWRNKSLRSMGTVRSGVERSLVCD